ncbi:Cobyric acid synthase [Chitinispirillum alkaliphilum]|nr:Cobyric acid synthase [Chitinispirillum alkaliphilum]
MMKSKSLMIQGTASSSGKSLIAAALCRILHQDGFRVAPFKAQNMSNNSFVTADGLEMGRAQVVQAYAAGILPDVRMNPVLLKPSSDTGAQVVLKGKATSFMSARDWHQTREMLKKTVCECYNSISGEYDIMILEGAGSPAEINLKKNDIVNMGMAEMADAPVIIVGDIDRGGVFASLVGTIQLLEPHERKRVKGFIINKFRGDVDLLKPGLDQLTQLTGIPTLGVVPWIEHCIDDEDGVTENFNKKNISENQIDICIIKLPHISNFTDFLPLQNISGVAVRWCDRAEQIKRPDILIIPGTKATISDLRVLKSSGIAEKVREYALNNGIVFGICGGFQMLGNEIIDESSAESSVMFETGLNLLQMKTRFMPDKRTVQVNASIADVDSALFTGMVNTSFTGYEIHMGKSEYDENTKPFTISCDSEGFQCVSGIMDEYGRTYGTYVHGIFDSGTITSTLINNLRRIKGLEPINIAAQDRSLTFENEMNRLAAICRDNLDMNEINKIINRISQ